MSARRISEKGSDIPINPHYIDFERTDGDKSTWPKNTQEILDSAGEVNFLKPLEIDHPHAIRWRLGAAKGIAIANKLPGPASRRFRSINEFIPHAIWLYEDPTMDPSNCQCKYCQKKPQKAVTASLPPGILMQSSSTPTPSRSKPSRPKGMRVVAQKRDKVYAAVQRAPIPAPSKSSNVHPKATMLRDRNADLRAISSRPSMKLRRWFRTGELLWCELQRPIHGPGGVVIRFWPGLVDEVNLKTKVIPRDVPSLTESPEQSGTEEDGDNADTVPWSVSQSTQYRMQLLGVTHSYLVYDDQVLPYQVHVPPDDLINALKAVPAHRLNFDREVLSQFNPCPMGESPDFDDAVSPYAMAVEIASKISCYWCLTDEWTFEYQASALQQNLPQPATSLPVGLPTAHVNGSTSTLDPSSSSSSSSSSYPNVSGLKPDMTPAEAQRLSARVLGKIATPPMHGSPLLTQIRFQGLWWGAERIWMDEFIRLKVPRRCIAPKGAEHILPPSGPGKSAREIWQQTGRDPSELGAGSRGVFMRLDGLFVVDAVQSDGSTKQECRASGMLYELADFDWEDPAKIPESSSINGHSNASSSTPPVSQPPPPSSQLSNPVSLPHYHLPDPPEGYVFRPILAEGHEAVLSLSMISGRYHARILSHPLMQTEVEMALKTPEEEGGLRKSNNLWAMEGLSAGFHNSIDPIEYKISRTKMVEDADKEAMRDLELHKRRQMSMTENSATPEDQLTLGYPDAMDVDH
ncbi:hypothetical protein H0H81_003815 [Sphagnurus paluster]|uniref:Cryptic loci regulator 2 N-terminal domain-containing protein n=1 Tax=Sphagnurus paluster TaxID=117069 RepID=A0A9P7GWX0_9AGAR|nr:hypothetical protein H0H81_003815 [Sphagnurus paluster]